MDVYGTYNELVMGVYKPTYNWGGPTLYIYIIYTHRIHGAGIYANIKEVFVDGIHGAPSIAAPWILWDILYT